MIFYHYSRLLAIQCHDSNTANRSSEMANGYHLVPISPIGILYQQLGTVDPIVSEFKLTTSIDTSSLDENHEEVENIHKYLEALCDRYIWEHHYSFKLRTDEDKQSNNFSPD